MDASASGLNDGGMTAFRLGEAQRDEVRAAARTAAGVPLAELTPESFPLPTAGAVLRRLAREVTGGAGFALLHGVPVDDDPDLICAGVGSYAGRMPDLAQVLYQPWWRDMRTGDGPDSFGQSPVYARDDRGRLSVSYGPDYIRSAQRAAHVPPLSPAQLEAMAVLDQLNSDPRFSVTMDLRPGDMQFLNNHIILHSRTAYEDHAEPERRRDLIRLWLDA